jgi:hypothetical protein
MTVYQSYIYAILYNIAFLNSWLILTSICQYYQQMVINSPIPVLKEYT